MAPHQNEILAGVAADTLEQLAFLFAFPSEGRDPADDGAAVRVAVDFRGPFAGRLEMCIDRLVLPEMAANMLGLEEDAPPSDEQQHDACLETINVICGNLLPLLGGSRSVFDLGAPRRLPAAAGNDSAPGPPPAARAVLELEAGACAFSLWLDDPELELPLPAAEG